MNERRKDAKYAFSLGDKVDLGATTYTVEEVANMLGISMSSAYVFVHSGEVPYVRIGKMIRISKRSFDEWLEKQNI